MEIIHIPHQSLRKVASPIEKVDKKFEKFLKNFKKILQITDNPKGVGLAGPQVKKLQRVFLTWLSDKKPPQEHINPRILTHSDELTLGPDPKKPRYEGCLSMPLMYGPVPRWQWVEVEYQVLDLKNGGNNGLRTVTDRLEDFGARVFQHEIDHLDGILFTDHSLKYNLPVFIQEEDDLVEIEDRRILEAF